MINSTTKSISKNIKLPTINDVQNASNILAPIIQQTPLLYSPLFDKKFGIKLYLKCDNLTPIGAFKIRGAFYALHSLSQKQKTKGVVAFSTGNHAQALAYSGNLLKIPVTIIMPKSAPKIKIENTKNFGANVILFDPKNENREEIAKKYVLEKKLTLIHPYDDFHVIAGQGISGLECAMQLRDKKITPDQFYIPVSGGGLLSGFSLGTDLFFKNADLIGVESSANRCWAASLDKGTRVKTAINEQSICDAIMPPNPIPGILPWEILKNKIAHIACVNDNDALMGIACAMKYFGIVLEPSAACSLGLICKTHKKLIGKTVIAVASGRNVDPKILNQSLTFYNQV